MEQRDWRSHLTILSGYDATRVHRVYHVVAGSADAALDGFVITGGYATAASPNNSGGGLS